MSPESFVLFLVHLKSSVTSHVLNVTSLVFNVTRHVFSVTSLVSSVISPVSSVTSAPVRRRRRAAATLQRENSRSASLGMTKGASSVQVGEGWVVGRGEGGKREK